MSNDTWMPAVPAPARFTACSTIDAMPWRSMSFIVNTCTPESRTAIFSRSSRLRMPMSTVCAGSTFGENAADLRELRRLGAEQRGERHAVDVARGDVAGVFMSPCASTQSRPIGRLLVRRAHSAAAATEPAPML